MLSASIRFKHVSPAVVPRPRHRDGETTDDDHRAYRGARIHVPSPLLRSPDGIHQDWMHATSPEEEGTSPRDVRVKLVVQASGAKAAHRHRRQNSRHNERRRHSPGDLRLSIRRRRMEQLLDRRRDGRVGRIQPSGRYEPCQQQCVDGEQCNGEGPRQEDLFANKPPVHRPLEQELARELKGAGDVAARVSSKEGKPKQNLSWQLAIRPRNPTPTVAQPT